MVLFFVHVPFVVNCTFSATPSERLQQDHNTHCSILCVLCKYASWNKRCQVHKKIHL